MDELLRVPPKNLEAEMNVLGACLIRPDQFPVVAAILTPESFYREQHRVIFKAMLALEESKQPLDTVLIGNLVGTEVFPLLAELVAACAAPSLAEEYATVVHEKSLLRSFIAASSGLLSDAYETHDVEEFLACAEYEIAKVVSNQLQKPSPSKAERLSTALWKLEHHFNGAIHTGYPEIDDRFGGFNVGHLTMLAARTSKGKTAFATAIAANVARAGQAVIYFTLEMTEEEMWLRAIGSESQVDMFAAHHRGYLADEKQRVEAARQTFLDAPLEILYRPGMRPRDLRIECKRLQRQIGSLKLIIIDYFNLMRGDLRLKERWREMAEAVLSLKELAGELAVPMLLLSQLNRETSEDKEPLLSNLRDTGVTEEHASNVVFLWEPPSKNGRSPYGDEYTDIEVVIAKQRNGPAPFKVPMTFKKKTGSFLPR